jgi:hypothetical protein
LFELINELAQHNPEIEAELDARLAAYAERLTPGMLAATGGDRFPSGPIRLVGAGR